ncbi:MAG: hypothetical protein R2827_04585 [Bdellovibrionales bacterium]
MDGSGKSTLIRGLCEHLDQRQLCYITTREPGGTPLAEEIRSLLLRHGEEVPHPRTELFIIPGLPSAACGTGDSTGITGKQMGTL